MKKLIFLILIFASSIFAQYGELTGGLSFPKASVWDDSLYTAWIDTLAAGDEDDDTLTARETVYIPLNFEYEWVTLTAIDTGATYDDSVKIWGTYYEVTPNQLEVEDTSETSMPYLRDSTWTQLTTSLLPVDDSSIHTYTIWAGALGGIILELSNVEVVYSRTWFYKLTAILK
jgi:hypothetical protein